jgi:methyl-accepting chemotaxis protein
MSDLERVLEKLEHIDTKVDSLAEEQKGLKAMVVGHASEILEMKHGSAAVALDARRAKESSHAALLKSSETAERVTETEKAMTQQFRAMTVGTGALMKATSNQDAVLADQTATLEKLKRYYPIIVFFASAVSYGIWDGLLKPLVSTIIHH